MPDPQTLQDVITLYHRHNQFSAVQLVPRQNGLSQGDKFSGELQSGIAHWLNAFSAERLAELAVSGRTPLGITSLLYWAGLLPSMSCQQ